MRGAAMRERLHINVGLVLSSFGNTKCARHPTPLNQTLHFRGIPSPRACAIWITNNSRTRNRRNPDEIVFSYRRVARVNLSIQREAPT